MFRTVQKACGGGGGGGGGGGWWLRPILVFSLSLDQAEQKRRKEGRRKLFVRNINCYFVFN